MKEDKADIFGEIARIEKQADEILEKARADAEGIRQQATSKVGELAAETDRQIEQAEAELADEYKTKTGQALTQIDVEFLKEEENLETIHERRFDELAGWTAARILERQLGPKTNGD